MAVPAPVHGQEAQTTTQASPTGLNDIIVTARRRAEGIQQVPLSVVALTGVDLESRSVTNLRSLQNFVPNVTFAASQNVGEAAGNIFIRGIGQEDFAAAAESGVGLYIDGVFIARATGNLLNLNDIARIEVLRGPQGTMFGKNTIGGVIQVISTMPQPGRQSHFSVIVGNDARVELREVSNLPLSDRLFVRMSIGSVHRNGYLHRLPPPARLAALETANQAPVNLEPEGNDRSLAGRLQLRWLISNTLTADFSLDASRKRNTQGATHIDAIDPGRGIFPQLNSLIRQGKLPGPPITADLPPDGLFKSYATGRNFTNQDLWGASATFTKTLGATTLKFIGAYRVQRSRIGADSDGLYFALTESDLRVNQHQLSVELQATGGDGPLAWNAGLFMFRERIKLPPSFSFMNETLFACRCFYAPASPPRLTTDMRKLGSDNFAGYAQGTYSTASGLKFTVGLRYSLEHKTIDGQTFRLDADLRPTSILEGAGTNQKSWNSFTYRGGLDYQATPNLMVYGSVAKGYKSGGFNARTALNLPNLGFYAFEPESAVSYEVGIRSEWLNKRLRLNATLFHTNNANLQVRQQIIVSGIATTLIENAARARIRGAEIEVRMALSEHLKFSASFGHLDPRYLDVGSVQGLTLSAQFQRTPRYSFSASVDWAIPLRIGNLEVHGDYNYRSKEQFQITAALNDQAGYGLVGARITLKTRDARWSIALFGTNLADVGYRTAGRGTLIKQTGIAYSSVGQPRQVGLQVAATF